MIIPPVEPEPPPEPHHCYRVNLEIATPTDRDALMRAAGMRPYVPKPGDPPPPPFEPTRLEGFLCGQLGDPCIQCGEVSEVLCDFPVGHEERTCDRPLCLTCAPEVGVDKNYCREHMELGPGLLLFKRPIACTWVEAPEIKPPRAKRLPKAPPPSRRWQVLKWDRGLLPSQLGLVELGWTTEANARAQAARTGGIVETWDQFVAAWRATYPLKKRPKP